MKDKQRADRDFHADRRGKHVDSGYDIYQIPQFWGSDVVLFYNMDTKGNE